MTVSRAGALLALGLLTGCGGSSLEPPAAPVAATLHYDYLTKLRLDVARIDVDGTWLPQDGRRHVEGLSPASPLQALRAMAEERLLPVGGSGHGMLMIDDAALTRDGEGYRGHFAVHLVLQAEDGRSLGGVVAQVSGTQPATGRVGDDLFALTRTLMDSINVELEYQLQQSRLLQSTAPGATATPVQAQMLEPPPGAAPAAPVPLDLKTPPTEPRMDAPTMSPPPVNLGTIPLAPYPPPPMPMPPLDPDAP